jgi:proteasome accessory factor B
MMTMLAATARKRTLRIHYQAGASGEITTRCVDPYGILFSGGEWYLVGYCHLRGEVRTFKVVRIQALEITDTRGRGSDSCVRKGFDLGVYARTPRWRHKTNGHSFSAKVWLDREAWHRVRNTGVFQGTVEEQPDGCFLTVEVGNAPAFASTILELGVHAELKEPEWLRSYIVAALGQMAEADR